MKKLIISLVLLFAPMLTFASIDTNLYYGLHNNGNVKELQEFLISKSFLTGPATGNFYSLTLNAVKKYQASQSINQTGYVGILTRTAINDDLANQLQESNVQTTNETGTNPPASESQKTMNDVVSTIQSQITLLQKQLEALKAQQTVIQQQNQVIKQIQQNTQQIVQNTTPVITPVPAPVPAFAFEPILTNSYDRDLVVVIKEKFDKCTLLIFDENGNKVREQDYWMTDKDGNSRQVYSMGTYGQHTYSITCDKSGFLTTTKTGQFPAPVTQ